MRLRFFEKPIFSLILSIILPGSGHILWCEYLFGLFVFFIMSLALGLFYASFILPLTSLFWATLLGMPILFYLFSMVDLRRAISKKNATYRPSTRKIAIMILLTIAFQLFFPGSPVRMLWDNQPTLFKVSDNDFSPSIRSGDYCLENPASYSVDLFFFDQLFYHTLPTRFELVRFSLSDDNPRTGLIVGLPDEQLEIVDGLLVANGVPIMEEPEGFVIAGDSPLTSCGPYSILVAELYLGRIKTVHEISLYDLKGKVIPLL